MPQSISPTLGFEFGPHRAIRSGRTAETTIRPPCRIISTPKFDSFKQTRYIRQPSKRSSLNRAGFDRIRSLTVGFVLFTCPSDVELLTVDFVVASTCSSSSSESEIASSSDFPNPFSTELLPFAGIFTSTGSSGIVASPTTISVSSASASRLCNIFLSSSPSSSISWTRSLSNCRSSPKSMSSSPFSLSPSSDGSTLNNVECNSRWPSYVLSTTSFNFSFPSTNSPVYDFDRRK